MTAAATGYPLLCDIELKRDPVHAETAKRDCCVSMIYSTSAFRP